MRKGILAFEELSEDLSPGVPPVTQVTDFVDAPENDLADAAKSEDEYEQTKDDIEAAECVAGAMDQVHDEIAKTIPEGGMNEAEATTLSVAVEALYASIKFPSHRTVFPAMENFTDKKDRVRATMETMADIKARGKQIWEAIMKAIKAAIDAVIAMFTAMFNATAGLKKRADSLAATAKAAKGDPAEISTSTFRLCNYGGDIVTADKLKALYERHASNPAIKAEIMKDFSTKYPKLGAVAETDDKAEYFTALKAGLGDFYLGEEKNSVGNTAHYVTELVFAGMELEQNVGVESLSVSTKLKKADPAKFSEKTMGLSAAQAGEIAALVSKHMNIYKDFKPMAASMSKLMSNFVRKQGDTKEELDKDVVTIKRMRSILYFLFDTEKALRDYDIKVTKSTLNYVAVSLSALK